MIKEWLSKTAELNMEIFGLIVFCIVFCAILLWTYRKSGKAYYASIETLPLEKEISL